MKSNLVVIIVLAVACVGLGGATVVTVSQNWQLREELEDVAAKQKPASKKSIPASASVERLRALLEERELAYAQLQDEYRQLRNAQGGSDTISTTEPRISDTNLAASSSTTTNASPSFMERLRQSDPERYRQMMEEREQRRQQREQWYADQMAELDRRARTAQTQEEADVATQIANALAKLNDLRAQWAGVRELPENQRRAAMEQLAQESRTAYNTLNELRPRDRQIQLGNLARSIGYTDSRAIQSFVDSVGAIYRNTEYHADRGFGGGGRR